MSYQQEQQKMAKKTKYLELGDLKVKIFHFKNLNNKLVDR